MLTPASKQVSISRRASCTSVLPQARKNSLPPPKVAVPKLSEGTFKPEPPSCLYSNAHSFSVTPTFLQMSGHSILALGYPGKSFKTRVDAGVWRLTRTRVSVGDGDNI